MRKSHQAHRQSFVRTNDRCRVAVAPGVRPQLRSNWNFCIPDLGGTCEGDRKGERIVSEPILLIEVLSPSNAADTHENMRAYATLPSVAELRVVRSTRIEAELLRKGDGNIWPANRGMIKGGDLQFSSIGLTVPVLDICAGTHLAS